jgi:ParB-like chromosome segregation protein Spo0J
MPSRSIKLTPWPADKVKRWPVAKLVPNARNARTHSDEQVTQLAASIEEFGWTIPVLVDEAGGIIAGHGRILAAHRLGIEDVPVMVAAGWSDAKKRAYMLADNKLTLNGEWDLERLAIEIAELRASDFDVSLVGFDESEIEALLREPGSTDVEGEWQGMPEYAHEDKTAFRTLPVHFRDQEAVDAFAERVGLTITPHTRFLWFPDTVIERYADKRYKTG